MSKFNDLADVLLRRERILVVSDGPTDPKKKLIFLSELASLGYEPVDTGKYSDSVLRRHSSIIQSLKKLKAGHVDYVPLFSGFPDKVPSELEHFSKRFYGLMGNVLGLFTNGQTLDSGVIVPEWLFDLNEFGADPITQFQDLGLFLRGIENQKARQEDTAKSLSKIRFVSEHEGWMIGQEYLNRVLSAKSSIKETLKDDIEKLLELYDVSVIDAEKITFKETKTYLLKHYWEKGDYESACALVTSPTDFLRLFASLTDGDVSLSQKIKFPKLARKQRNLVVQTLNGFPNLAEDLNRYRGLWIAIGRGLHVGEYRTKYANVATAFNALRNEKIETWNTVVESNLSNGSYQAVLGLLKQRPSEFARRLHALLRMAKSESEQSNIVASFSAVADKIPLKTLIVLERYIDTIDNCENRTVINKKGRIKIFKNDLYVLNRKVIEDVRKAIEVAVLRRISSEKSSWEGKKVWIDPSLSSFVVPLQQRKASEAFLTAGRGTRIKFDDSKVLRLFIWWKEKSTRTDLDLSLIQFDEKMNYQGHVSYTRLADEGIVHSGDITSAPHGAAEFIDVKLDVLKKKGVRYIAPQIYRFAGNSFAEMDECYAGWMCREKVDRNYKSFDIKTVENAFNLNGNAAYSLPIIVDLQTNEIVFVDLYVGMRELHNRVENSLDSVSTIAKEVVKMTETKPNIFALAKYHAMARGAEQVESREDADLTIGISDCDFNATKIESVLSEFLV